MAEWSQMPEDLLELIARRLDTQFDVLRFRSVCSSWRSSVAPSPSPSRRGRFPILPNDGISDAAWGFHLSRRTIFLLGVPRTRDQTVPSGWLLKVKEDVPRSMNLLNPLSRCPFTSLPEDFPRVLDLMNLHVLELGHEYVLQYMSYRPCGNDGHLYMEKVVFLCLDSGNDFALLTIHVSGKLAMFKSGEKRWSIIQDMPSPYDDVILFKGEFYAVDGTGRTVVVGLDLGVTLIAQSNWGGDKKFLVESVGELLLVDMYLSLDAENDHDGVVAELPENFDYFMRERTVRFKVYKLDREEKEWNEVKDLGDRVLFLGDDCTFSASAADLRPCKGNCIFFADNWEVERALKSPEIGVYDMDSGIIGPLEDYAGYSELFWPPPDWIASRTSEVQNQLETLAA
ncbi:F-box protein SKIP23 [Rhodamnia argentea]|uniref:F-box protein SKIP23 n=1 Tax=Rhodamnia argentea TaxID=178133 RepID=A0A8B8NKU1_9MYRT|nr:F-box protein SKIP23 [Rhodamnia argentea]